MLKIYICPKCYNFRMVSKKNNAICLHCSGFLRVCTVSFDDFSSMNEIERNNLKERLKQKFCNSVSIT